MVIILKGTVNEKRLINEQEDLANDVWLDMTIKKFVKGDGLKKLTKSINDYKKSAKLRELEGGKKDEKEENINKP